MGMLHSKQKRKEGRRAEAGEGEQLHGSTPGTGAFPGSWATMSRPTRPSMPWPSWSQALDLIFVPLTQSGFRASACSGTCWSWGRAGSSVLDDFVWC